MKVNEVGEVLESLKARWQGLVESSQAKQEVAEQLFFNIVAAYSEPHRYYHNLNHLQHMFSELDSCENEPKLKVTDEMKWAVWYHDIVYKPGAKTNEKKSAEVAKEALSKLEISGNNIDRVMELIMATKSHQCDSNDSEAQLFLDADMAILGSSEINYKNYNVSIRMEHSNIPVLLFNRGRKKFLASVLKQDRIFTSEHFNSKHEKMARKNIQRELSS